MKKHLKIRHLLANMGKELTPDEAQFLTDQMQTIINNVTPAFVEEIEGRSDVEDDVKSIIAYIHKMKEGWDLGG